VVVHEGDDARVGEGAGVELFTPVATLGAEIDDEGLAQLGRFLAGLVIIEAPFDFLGGRDRGAGQQDSNAASATRRDR